MNRVALAAAGALLVTAALAGPGTAPPHATTGATPPHATARAATAAQATAGRGKLQAATNPHATAGRGKANPHATAGRGKANPHATAGRGKVNPHATAGPGTAIAQPTAGRGRLQAAAGSANPQPPADRADPHPSGGSGMPRAWAAPAVTAPVRILPLGDSITYGRWSETTSSYRIDLQRRLRAAGMTVDFVGSQRSGRPATADLDHEGHPGWRIEQLAARVDGWLATYRPDVVLVLAGTNDMRQNHRAATAPDRLAALLDRIHERRPAAHVFVQQLPSSTTPSVAARIAAFNAAIPGIAAERASYVHVVDQSGIGGVLLADALHPHDHGFALMSYNLYRAMEGVLRAGGAAWPAGVNPHLATRARMCTVATTRDARGRARQRWDCATWHRRPLTTVRDGRPVTETVWQRQRAVTQTRRVWVPGRYETVPRTSPVRVYVAGHYEQRRRTVLRWVTA